MVDSIGATAASSTLPAPGQPAAPATADGARSAVGEVRRPESPKGTSINISSDGRSKLEEEQKKRRADTSDIDNSGLDDDSKNILKKIRELEQQVQDKVQELQQVMADKSLTEKQRDQKVDVLRTELGSLEGAIDDATQSLNEALAAARASSDQVALAHSLIHP